MYWICIYITVLLLIAYSLLILQYRKWFLRLPLYQIKNISKDKTQFSVIIPARNEEENIQQCLRSVLEQNYPTDKFEVIVINDHSTDQTASIIQSMQEKHANLQLLNLEDHLNDETLNAYKKKAIEIAIRESTGNWIVTTDADCFVSSSWLSMFDAYIQDKEPVFIAAPVMFTNTHSFLSTFQVLDFMSLQGITAASVSAGYHTMCNGANIAYKKEAFYEVGQFQGIDQIASGDDMLLMHKMKEKYPGKLGYLFCHEAIVTTPPMQNWLQFFNQRIRWASKASSYGDKSIFWVLVLVYSVNLALLALLLASPFVSYGFNNWLLLIVLKTIIELTFMIPISRFFNDRKIVYWFPIMQPFHILYTVIAGWLGKFGTYQWKGRTVK
jgi:cellulose synthase/poly-beta-1,6-N-acetylglucosamine synthase-like glycosyltransferase